MKHVICPEYHGYQNTTLDSDQTTDYTSLVKEALPQQIHVYIQQSTN